MALDAARRWVRTRRLTKPPGVRRAYRRLVARRVRLWLPILRHLRLASLPPEVATHLVYEALLDRGADLAGLETYVPGLISGSLAVPEMAQWIRGSSEFEAPGGFSYPSALAPSIHAGRCRFIRALPRAGRIVDLGGVDLGDERGALIGCGYPYRFDSLVVVDLPSDERHELYRSAESSKVHETELGPVSYRYHSMVDLSDFPDRGTDLVYSGQSIEHVEPEEAVLVLKEVFRILRPGGSLALDTPNGRITRLQQDAFVDPDHKVEYTWPELQQMLVGVGFRVEWAKGLNYAGRSVANGCFDIAEVAGNCGLYDEIEDCYILAVVASRPGP